MSIYTAGLTPLALCHLCVCVCVCEQLLFGIDINNSFNLNSAGSAG